MKTVFYGGKIVLKDSILENHYLVCEDGIITDIAKKAPKNADKVIDLNGNYISAGFMDIHVHGGGGYDFNDASKEAIIGASKEHLKHGTTAIMPTVVACSTAELDKCINVYDSFTSDEILPNFLGLHLEGPYISPNQAGAIDPDYLKIPKREEYLKLLDSTDSIKRMTVAPELDGAMELGRELESRGILASVGHSDAEFEDVEKATKNGFKNVTHLYSAMSMVHRKNAYRKLGVLESAFLLDNLTVEIIADGCHLPIELINLIIKVKGTDNVCLITDAMRGAGMLNGTETVLGSLENGRKVIIKDDVAFMPDMSCFAGSVCTTDRCVRTLYKNTDLPLYEIVKMITYNPAKVLGVQEKYGNIEKGKVADLVVFDDDITVKDVYIGGKKA